jgi:hypothetical protein
MTAQVRQNRTVVVFPYSYSHLRSFSRREVRWSREPMEQRLSERLSGQRLGVTLLLLAVVSALGSTLYLRTVVRSPVELVVGVPRHSLSGGTHSDGRSSASR